MPDIPKILIVEDDLRMSQLFKELLEKEGYSVAVSGDGSDAIILLKEHSFDVVLTDLKMPSIDGMNVLAYSKETNPETPVIVITAYATVDSAVEALKRGAYDYIQKPFDPDELLLVVKRAVDYRRLINENIRLSTALEGCIGYGLVGMSKGIVRVQRLVENVSPFDTTVLLQGETGTGKEMVAQLIHRLSSRAAEKFLAVNCGALTETLLEAELFGYEQGAFTGATRRKRGLFEAANRGTIFLDEIDNASQSMQMKLLRVLQDGMMMKVGGIEPVAVDVRVIAASNVDLKAEVENGRFRRDLFYRLNVVTINIPPLRSRRDDIQLLAYHFLNKYCRRHSKEIKGFHQDTIEILMDYPWPGNVRELENAIEHSVIMSKSIQAITPESLPEDIRKRQQIAVPSYTASLRLDEMERSLIQRALSAFKGQKAKAAEALGISVSTLWRKLKKFQLE